MDILVELNSIFRDYFENPAISINPKTTANDIDGWDSFNHVNLIYAIETHFNIEFSQSEALSFENVGDIIDSIKMKQGKQ